MNSVYTKARAPSDIKKRLDALTSLRFFAAAMIVIHHCSGLFGLSNNYYHPFAFAQGISFFFILSGFILAYNYPNLEGWSDIKKFWRSRIARIWPALFTSFIFAFWFLSFNWETKTGLLNLLMLNAWIPLPKYFFSYNSPSWSISTELFFYLVFPYLIYKWHKTSALKLILSAVMVVVLIVVCDYFALPKLVSMSDGLTRTALLGVHPVARLFEFIFGMLLASHRRKQIGCKPWGENRASIYEATVTVIAVASVHYVVLFADHIETVLDSPSLTEWLYSSGSMFAFGLLIYVFSMGRGRITSWLAHPLLVLLGEISFSLYLLHQIFLRYYQINIARFPDTSPAISLAIFWIIALISSYLMWVFIEMPSRRYILGRDAEKMHGSKVLYNASHNNQIVNKLSMSILVVLICLVASIRFAMK